MWHQCHTNTIGHSINPEFEPYKAPIDWSLSSKTGNLLRACTKYQAFILKCSDVTSPVDCVESKKDLLQTLDVQLLY